jgi:hypothetical protein
VLSDGFLEVRLPEFAYGILHGQAIEAQGTLKQLVLCFFS